MEVEAVVAVVVGSTASKDIVRGDLSFLGEELRARCLLQGQASWLSPRGALRALLMAASSVGPLASRSHVA